MFIAWKGLNAPCTLHCRG